MIKVIYSVFQDYGLDAVQLAFIVWFAWKLFTNHFAHLTADLKGIKDGVKNIDEKLEKHNTRISHIEGKLS